MKNTTSILLGFAFMAFLCLQATALPFLSDSSLKNSVIKAAAGYTGVVDIRKDWDPSTGFYVEANLGYYANDSQAKSNKTSTIYPELVTKMMISLSNNETMLAVRCLDFTYYNCTSFHCQQQPTEKYYDIVYPTFMVTASLAQSYIYLDKKYWTIASTPFYLASQCLTGDLTSGLGKNRSGVLGLGTDGDAANDFKLSKKFAIYINPNLTDGQLLFTDDISYAKSTDPMFTLNADSTWKTYVLSGSVITSSGAAGFKGDLIFDINSDAIGLPYDVFTLFMVYFTKTPGLSCNADLYKPLCSIDNFQLLADITIQFDGKSIKIPPSVYAVPTTGNYFNLNLKAISPNQPGKSYVTPGYKNCIILDANFMSYYFTVFDATSGSNKIYLYEAGDKRNIIGGGDFPWATVVIVLIILIVVIACCVAKNKTVSKDVDTVVTNTTQQPLVYNYPAYTQGNAQPQGVYPTPNYTNNGYQQPQGGVYYNQ